MFFHQPLKTRDDLKYELWLFSSINNIMGKIAMAVSTNHGTDKGFVCILKLLDIPVEIQDDHRSR